MFPISTQTGDDRRDRNLSSPHRHRYRHHPKSNVRKGFGLLVTIGDDPPQAYAGKHKKECISSLVYAKACDPSSPIVTETRLTLENKWFSVVTMAVTMQKRGVYRHPYRHRHGFCNGEVTPDQIDEHNPPTSPAKVTDRQACDGETVQAQARLVAWSETLPEVEG